jgi:hypothetical protein
MPAHLWRALELASVLMDFDVGAISVPVICFSGCFRAGNSPAFARPPNA